MHATNLINEQKSKAMNRLEWHYIDEVSRPDSMNKEYEKLIKETQIAPMGKNVKETAEAFNKNLEIYFQFAEARFADNVIRTVTTHILDVPLNDELTRAKTEKPSKYVFLAMDIEKGHDLTELMKLRDDFRIKREAGQKKLEQLMKLQQIFQEQASAQTEDDRDDKGDIKTRNASPGDLGNHFNDFSDGGPSDATLAPPTFTGTLPLRGQGPSGGPMPPWARPTMLTHKRNDRTDAHPNGIHGQ